MDDGDNGDRRWLRLDGGDWMWLVNAKRLDDMDVIEVVRERRRLDVLDLDIVRDGRTGKRRRGA